MYLHSIYRLYYIIILHYIIIILCGFRRLKSAMRIRKKTFIKRIAAFDIFYPCENEKQIKIFDNQRATRI